MTTADVHPPPRCASSPRHSNAWPFEEARKLVARLKKTAQGRGDLRDRLRPLGPAAYRHLRRGRAHHHGAPRLPRADRRQVKTRLIAFSDDMDGLRKVPDNVPNKEMLAQHLGKPLTQVPDPFGTHPSFGAAQQCAAARLPRPVRLRIRVPVLDRMLQVRPLRRGAAHGARALRRGDGDHAAVAARGARADLFAVPADLARAPASCCRCRSSRTTPRPAPSPTTIPTPASA